MKFICFLLLLQRRGLREPSSICYEHDSSSTKGDCINYWYGAIINSRGLILTWPPDIARFHSMPTTGYRCT